MYTPDPNKDGGLLATEDFDGEWYLAQYPDVVALGMAPLDHYHWIGARLGRKAGPDAVPGLVLDMPTRPDVQPQHQTLDRRNFGMARRPAEYVGADLAPAKDIAGISVGIHAHMYYADLAPEFAQYLGRMPCRFDLYVSVPDTQAYDLVTREFGLIANIGKLDVRIVPNIGRDIGPFVVEFAKDIARYDVCGHIQSKKSLYNKGATDGWRQYIMQSLFENNDRISSYIELLYKGRYGIIYPQTHYTIPYMAHTWLANRGLAGHFASRFRVSGLSDGYFDFPAGSMFWARTDAIRPLLDAGLEWHDFPPEQGQTDGTLAHCIERMLGVVPTSRHFQHGVIRDSRTASWSRWRFSQFLDRPIEHIRDTIADPAIKVVGFDIFDTLLTRPFLNADYVKTLLDTEYTSSGITGFHAMRAAREGEARAQKGADVDIHEIYQAFGAAGGDDGIRFNVDREMALEIASVRPRTAVVDLFNLARQLGKRVILASDMFLPRNAIETMLDTCGIGGWDHFYLSCEVGVRKDSGRLYEHILARENISPEEMVMIGDNERSDFQIPADMGVRAVHVMKSSNLLRAVPRFADIVPENDEARIDEQFVFGAIAAENFSAISFPDFAAEDMFGTARHVGYGLLGPIIVSFCQWLERRVEEEGLTCLHFMAREGKFLKRAFDLWQRRRPDPVRTEYLLISRRAVTVPCITTLDDVFDIAAANNFYGASMDIFLTERFGVTLDDAVWAAIERQGLWQRQRPLEIMDGQIDHAKPFFTAILPHVLAQAEKEKLAAISYFDSIGLNREGAAVVDVGYGGTIQRHLVKLLGRRIPGLYMVTDEKGHAWGQRTGISISGCFVEGAARSPDTSPMFLHSFLLEKMLSTNDQQVMRYASGGRVEYRVIPGHDDPGLHTRMNVQDAAMKFVMEAVRVRDGMASDLSIGPDLCEMLYGRFSTHLSANERRIFASLELDDFYCGRGIVS